MTNSTEHFFENSLEVEVFLTIPSKANSRTTIRDIKLFLEKAELLGFTDDDELYEVSLTASRVFLGEDFLPTPLIVSQPDTVNNRRTSRIFIG